MICELGSVSAEALNKTKDSNLDVVYCKVLDYESDKYVFSVTIQSESALEWNSSFALGEEPW